MQKITYSCTACDGGCRLTIVVDDNNSVNMPVCPWSNESIVDWKIEEYIGKRDRVCSVSELNEVW